MKHAQVYETPLMFRTSRNAMFNTARRAQVFEKQTTKDGRTPCPYRIAHEGLPAVLPFVSKQRLYPTVEEFVDLLSQRAMGLPSHLHQLSEAHQVGL